MGYKEDVDDPNKEYSADDLKQIDYEHALDVFNNGYVLYIQDTEGRPSSTVNLFAITKDTWDASLNLYPKTSPPMEYGFQNILNWIKERNNGVELKFYTLYKKTFYLVENVIKEEKSFNSFAKIQWNKFNDEAKNKWGGFDKYKTTLEKGKDKNPTWKEYSKSLNEGVAQNNPKIEKYVNQINQLIAQAVDSDGDPIGVVDPTSTWEEPYIYEPIVYQNGALKIVSRSNYQPGKINTDIVRSRDMEYDGIPTLQLLSRMYKKALKNKDRESVNSDI